MKLLVSAGPHTRKNTICSFTLPAEQIARLAGDRNAVKLVPAAGDPLPAAVTFDGDTATVWFILDYLSKNETAVFTVKPAARGKARMRAEKTDRGISVYEGKNFVTEYYVGTDLPKPYLGPLNERYGAQISRLDFSVKEHPHHRSIWVSHGSVNGVDTWNEPAGKHGYIRNQALTDLFDSDVMTSFTAHNKWTSHEGDPLCDETTTYRIFATPAGAQVIDVEITLTASYGEVTLGPTKEAGPIAVRVAESIKVQNGGTMVNAYGAVGESEIWMKRAPWVDYYGQSEGHICGVALFDNMDNELYPAYWHSRDYGLMAVNNFFKGGALVIAAGEKKNFKYRFVLHNGTTEEACIADRFNDYAAMPTVKAE